MLITIRTKLNSTQLNSTQLNSTQLNSTQLNSTQLNSTQLNSTQLNSTLPYPTTINDKFNQLKPIIFRLLPFIFIYVFLFFLNFIFPLQSDDLGDKYTDFKSAISSAYNSYMGWNGRIGDLFRVSFGAALSPSVAFSFINAFIGTCVIYLFFILFYNRFPLFPTLQILNLQNLKSLDRKDSIISQDIGILSFMLFFMLSSTISFGSIFFWQSGSYNYLWAHFFILLFLLPYRIFWDNYFKNIETFKPKNIESNSFLKLLILFFIAFIAGWGQEVNIAIIVTYFIFLAFGFYKKVKFPTWYYVGILGFICGYLLLYFSPGSARRMSYFVESGAFLSLKQVLHLGIFGIINRLSEIYIGYTKFVIISISIFWIIFSYKITKNSIYRILLITLFIIFGVICYVYKLGFYFTHFSIVMCIIFAYYFRNIDKNFAKLSLILALILCLLCLYLDSIIQLGGLASRTKLHIVFIFISLFLAIFYYLKDSKIMNFLSFVFIILCVIKMTLVSIQCLESRYKWEQMLGSIDAQKRLGQKDIVVDSNSFGSKYSRYGDWMSPGKNADVWPNTSYANYFKVNSFKAIDFSKEK
ncbi:DUF6056 family protein [Helicobacter saguini]|uniref:DUF6056 family protein n=1 Tax=Helicobacter saguini TaxID=1548018 RepID=UPI00301CF4CE